LTRVTVTKGISRVGTLLITQGTFDVFSVSAPGQKSRVCLPLICCWCPAGRSGRHSPRSLAQTANTTA
jgi:hypothetical protein